MNNPVAGVPDVPTGEWVASGERGGSLLSEEEFRGDLRDDPGIDSDSSPPNHIDRKSCQLRQSRSHSWDTRWQDQADERTSLSGTPSGSMHRLHDTLVFMSQADLRTVCVTLADGRQEKWFVTTDQRPESGQAVAPSELR